MPKEKAKSKRAPSRFSWRTVMVILSTILLLILILSLSLPIYPPTVSRTSLPDDLRPLAEAVMQESIIFEYIPVMEDLFLAFHYYKGASVFGEYNICINISQTTETSYHRHSQIYVNGARVYGVWGQLEQGRCVLADLDTGLHLIEFHLRDSAWGEPVAIQRWAIEIE